MATLKELMDGLSPEARKRVEARATELRKEIDAAKLRIAPVK